MLPKLGLSFLSKKASKAGLNPTDLVGGFFKAKAKLILFGIIVGVSFFFILIMVVLGVVSYFLGLVQENVDRIENTFNQACILCSNEDLEKKKEAQFVSKIDIIAENSNMQNLWNRYVRKHPFAKGITFTQVIQAIQTWLTKLEFEK